MASTKSASLALVFKNNYIERDVSWMFFNHRILAGSAERDCASVGAAVFLGNLQ